MKIVVYLCIPMLIQPQISLLTFLKVNKNQVPSNLTFTRNQKGKRSIAGLGSVTSSAFPHICFRPPLPIIIHPVHFPSNQMEMEGKSECEGTGLGLTDPKPAIAPQSFFIIKEIFIEIQCAKDQQSGELKRKILSKISP